MNAIALLPLPEQLLDEPAFIAVAGIRIKEMNTLRSANKQMKIIFAQRIPFMPCFQS